MSTEGAASPKCSYDGPLELTDADGRVVQTIRARIQDIDAPVWAAKTEEPVSRTPRGFDPAGDTVIVRLADPSHARCGETAAAHVMVSAEGRIELAGNYSFQRSNL